MASPFIWSNGLGGTGVDAAGAAPAYFSAAPVFLDAATGSDSNAGTEPELPKATLASALSVAAANATICVAELHTETIAATVTAAAAGVRVIGFGLGGNRPRFTCNTTTTDMLAMSAVDITFQNLIFPAAAQSTTGFTINLSQLGCKLRDCLFYLSANNTVGGATVATSRARVTNCQFVALGARPAIGLLVSGTGAGNEFIDLIFDGGLTGWTDYACKVSGANTTMKWENITLLNRSDFGVTVTGSGYQLIGAPMGGQGKVLLTA